MALVLIKEDGTGKPDANSYANAADGDAYHEGHLYASAWTAATLANKEKALVMATRLIDAHHQFNGFRKLTTQALQWPREEAIDPDRNVQSSSWLSITSGPYLANDKVPQPLVDATCEQAREMLIVDRTGPPLGEGLASMQGSDLSRNEYDKADRRPVISHVAQAMLSKYGAMLESRSGAVRLVRA